MNPDTQVYFRLQCLSMAAMACGADVSPDFVLEAAQKYYQWLTNKKPELRVVPNDNGGAA
jgi:hypothetical protein